MSSTNAQRRPVSFIAVGVAAWLLGAFWLQPIVFVFRGGGPEQLAAILTTLGAWVCALSSIPLAAYKRGRVRTVLLLWPATAVVPASIELLVYYLEGEKYASLIYWLTGTAMCFLTPFVIARFTREQKTSDPT